MSDKHDVSEAFEEQWDAEPENGSDDDVVSGGDILGPVSGSPMEMAEQMLAQAAEALLAAKDSGGVTRDDLIRKIMAPIGAALVAFGTAGWNEPDVTLEITVGPGKGRGGGPRASNKWRSIGVMLPGSAELSDADDDDDDD